MKQKGGNRKIFISIFVILINAGIIVGVLFATGVLGKKSSGTSPIEPTPTPKPGPFTPIITCDQMPTVTSFNRIEDGSYRLTFSPIPLNCIGTKSWMYWYSMTVTDGRTGSAGQSFNPVSGQTFVDIDLQLPFNDPYSPIKSATGQVWLQTVNSDGSGDLQNSNNLPYVVTNI